MERDINMDAITIMDYLQLHALGYTATCDNGHVSKIEKEAQTAATVQGHGNTNTFIITQEQED